MFIENFEQLLASIKELIRTLEEMEKVMPLSEPEKTLLTSLQSLLKDYEQPKS
jgi:hypothetical protein